MEVWKDVVGYEGSYKISNYSNVKSLDRSITQRNGTVISRKGQLLKPRLDSKGYYFLRLGNKNKWVHRMIIESFVRPMDGKEVVNHKDGVKTNNSLENLEICSSGYNQKHAYATGLRGGQDARNNGNYKGTIFGFHAITGDQVEFNSRKEMKDQGFEPSSVYACCLGKLNRHKGFTFWRLPIE